LGRHNLYGTEPHRDNACCIHILLYNLQLVDYLLLRFGLHQDFVDRNRMRLRQVAVELKATRYAL